MTGQAKHDDDEPPFVLQNCSAMSREIASSTEKQKPKRGWGLGWFTGTNNSNTNNDNDDENENNAPEEKEKDQKVIEKKETLTNSNSFIPELDKSLFSTIPLFASSSSAAQPTTPSKTPLHPPSPKSLSPRYASPAISSSTSSVDSAYSDKDSQQSSKNEVAKDDEANGIANGGTSPDELSRQNRREEVRQKTAWYEEYIRNQLAKQGGNQSSLTKDDVVAFGLFEKQRKLNRRARLWGRGGSEAEKQLTDEELDQLLVLADRSNQAQNDEAELEMLLVQMESNNKVDMDRLYHLELLSRQRLGEILNEEELDELQIFEEKKRDNDDLLELRKNKKNGIDDVDEVRLRELTLLERKLNGDKSMTEDELQEAEIIEMRREDARLNERDFNKLLRLKEQGGYVDEDQFNLLSLFDRRRRRVELIESETEMLEQYSALREKEYLERIESTNDREKKDRSDKKNSDTEQSSECLLQKGERQGEPAGGEEKQRPDNFVDKKEAIDDKEGEKSETFFDMEESNELLHQEERSEQLNRNGLGKLELLPRQQHIDGITGDQSIDNEKINGKSKDSEAEETNETKSASTFDEASISLSERVALEEFRCQLKKKGLPLAISFTPFGEDDDSFDMSIVSFSDVTYVNDLVFQKQNRESQRKEECLGDAVKIYRRTIKKQELPESEEMLLAIFSKLLKQRNKEMRKADKQFDELVENQVSLSKLRKQEAQNERTDENLFVNDGEKGSGLPTNEETTKKGINTDFSTERQSQVGIEIKNKCSLETAENSAINAAYDKKTIKSNPQQTTIQGWGMGLFKRIASNNTDVDGMSQAKESKGSGDGSHLLNQAIEPQIERIEHLPSSPESEGEIRVTQGEEVPGSSINSREEKEPGRIIFFPFGDRRNEEVTKLDIKDSSQSKALKDGYPLENHNDKLVDDSVDGETDVCDGLSSRESIITEDNTESVENYRDNDRPNLEKGGGSFIEFDSEIPREDSEVSSNRKEMEVNHHTVIIERDCSQSETGDELLNASNHEDLDVLQSTQNASIDNKEGVKEIYRARESTNKDVQSKYKQSEREHDAENEELNTFESNPEGHRTFNRDLDHVEAKADYTLCPGTEGEEIETDLLYELELVTRLRKGIHLTERQDYELDLLICVRQGGTLFEEEAEDFKLLKKEREQTTLNDVYLRGLRDRSSRGQPVNEDLLYEVELFHKDLSCETLSNDEQMELDLFERRLNGGVLTQDFLEELDLLKNKRLSRDPTDHHSGEIHESSHSGRSTQFPTYHEVVVIKEPSVSEISSRIRADYDSVGIKDDSISEMPSRLPVDRRSAMKIERALSIRMSSVRKLERMISRRHISVEDEDSIYMNDLLYRQKAGQRLDQKEFQWLQILTKKSRNEDLDEDDIADLEILRSQRNETEVDFVNTKSLLEKELKRQHKFKAKEQRRKEKEERREQRKKEMQQREKAKKFRRMSSISNDAVRMLNTKTGSDERVDLLDSRDTTNEVQIIGTSMLQLPRPEENKKEEPVLGVFAGVFGRNAKQRQEQQLQEAKRRQAELIKEQMKVLRLDNEVEELEREKVMQEQLVQETIEKKIAESVDGGSHWESSTAEKFDEIDASSWSSSWESSLSESYSQSEEVNGVQKNENDCRHKSDHGIVEKPPELSKSFEGFGSDLSNDESNFICSSQERSTSNGESTRTRTADNEKDQIIPPNQQDRVSGEQVRNPVVDSVKRGRKEERRPSSGELKSTTRRSSSLGFHLKKKKKKRTKRGDDVSLGTLQLSKSSLEISQQIKDISQNNREKATKSKDRPWIVDDSIDNSINTDNSDTSQKCGLESHNEKPSSGNDEAFEFNSSFVSRISEGEDEDEEENESVSSVHLDTEEDRDIDTEKVNFLNAEQSLLDSFASFTSIGEEAYDLGIQEYENIESRLRGKVTDKQAEFDLTWENTVADENVIAQINQRLRERQRVMEAKREKKNERKSSKNLQEVPRLFLFQGERAEKNGRSKRRKKKTQKKLDRTLTKEFRKAMKEIFDSDSDSDFKSNSDDENRNKMKEIGQTDDNDIGDDKIFCPVSAHSLRNTDDDASCNLSYSENVTKLIEDTTDSDEEDDKFDGEYLKRLKARSLPTDLKRMLSGRHMLSKRNMVSSRNLMSSRNKNVNKESSGDYSITSNKVRRRPRRKKTGEIVNDNIDPAEVYAQELEKQKGEKTFTIASIRKELEHMKRRSVNSFTLENNGGFGNFDNMSPSLLNNTKVKPTKVKRKKTYLGKGIESLERQRPGLSTARSVRSLNTTFSDQGLLTGNRQMRRREKVATINEGKTDEVGKSMFTSGGETTDDEFGNTLRDSGLINNPFERKKLLKHTGLGEGTRFPSLLKPFTKPFKKKSTEFENASGGGLLDMGQPDGFNDNDDNIDVIIEESFRNMPSFGQQDPIALRANKVFEKMNVRGMLSKLKMPGNNQGNRKFGVGFMMDNDDEDNNQVGGNTGLL